VPFASPNEAVSSCCPPTLQEFVLPADATIVCTWHIVAAGGLTDRRRTALVSYPSSRAHSGVVGRNSTLIGDNALHGSPNYLGRSPRNRIAP
jgi:hypothetical protein